VTWWVFLAWFLAILLTLLLLRVPVAFAMLGVGMAGAVYSFGGVESGLQQVALSVQASISSFVFTPIPLFILMGELLFRTRVAQDALDEIGRWLGRLPGSLAMVSVGAGAMFGLLSGSTLANTALFGSTLLPEMKQRGYSEKLAVGSILASGGLAMILPPSALAILWGAIAGVPIGPLLIAGVIPGLLMAVGYAAIVIYWSVARNGAPRTSAATRRGLREAIAAGCRYTLPLGLIVVVVLGLIFFGIATPTESAAVGALAALAMGLAYGRLTRAVLAEAAIGAARTTAVIFLILLGSTLYSQLMSFSGATRGLIAAVTGSISSEWLLLALIMLVLLVLGAIIDQVSIMLVTAPLFMPIVETVGWDPVWFSVLVLINLQIANTTPPFGMSLFVMKGVSPNTPITTVYASALPWIGSDLVVILLVATFPWLAVGLPALMG
jgi:tripartite ATP-independent transporter DctM subunit